MIEGLERSALQEINEIKAALDRIDDGTYGICTVCDEPIPEARLKAYPTAAICVDCSSR